MAISPKQAKELTEGELQFLKRLEQEIDKLLQANYVSGNTVVIDFKDIGADSIPPRIFGPFQVLYSAVGWHVISNSGRDGNFLEFTPEDK